MSRRVARGEDSRRNAQVMQRQERRVPGELSQRSDREKTPRGGRDATGRPHQAALPRQSEREIDILEQGCVPEPSHALK